MGVSSEWLPMPAGTPWALIKSMMWPMTSMRPAMSGDRSFAVRVEQRGPLVHQAFDLIGASSPGRQVRDADHRLDLAAALLVLEHRLASRWDR